MVWVGLCAQLPFPAGIWFVLGMHSFVSAITPAVSLCVHDHVVVDDYQETDLQGGLVIFPHSTAAYLLSYCSLLMKNDFKL